jgi:hypothetical protein
VGTSGGAEGAGGDTEARGGAGTAGGDGLSRETIQGFLEERMYLLLAEGLTAGEAQPEEDEKIEVRAFHQKELKQMIKSGRMRDAKSIAGILYYLTFLR